MVMFAQFCEYGKNLKKQKERDLKKKSKSQLSSRGMNQSDKNVFRGSLISSYENLSVEPLCGQ